jgi:hypothetical protein
MQMHVKINTGEIPSINYDYIRRTIEGMDNMYFIAVLPVVNFSIEALFMGYANIVLSTNILLISLIIVLSVITFFLYKYYIKNISSELIFLLGIVLVYLSELFMPAVRFNYYDVIFVNTLLLLILNMNFISDIVNPFLFFLTLGFISNVLYFEAFRSSLAIGSMAMLIYILSMTIILYKSKKSQDKLA